MAARESKEELEAFKLLLKYAFAVTLNANDFFGFACADAVEMDTADFSWALPIIVKYKDDGVNAVMSYIAKCKPLEEYQTPEFKQAAEEITKLNPKVYSEYE